MGTARIGVDLDDLGLAPKAAMGLASEMQFGCAELATVSGDVAAWNLSASGRRHLARLAKGFGIRLEALVADMPQLRLSNPNTAEQRIDRTLQVIELAADMEVPIVTASLSKLTDSQTGDPNPSCVEALGRIGEFAISRGRSFCIRPSTDSGERLAALLERVNCPAIHIGLDPADMVMVGSNPLAAQDRLAERISLFHARDATAGTADHAGREVALGAGEVDMVGVLAMLDAAGFQGAYILRRTESNSASEQILQSRETLQRLLPPS